MTSGNSTPKGTPAFIVNRRAGAFLRDPTLEGRVRQAAGARSMVLATDDEEGLARAVERALEARSSPVVLCGGDGTYLAGMTALARAARGADLPPIAFGRAGTVSIVAKSWGARRDVVKSVRDIVERPAALRRIRRPTLAVEADGDVRVGFTFGTGLVARFFAEYDAQGARGNGAALGMVVRIFADALRGGDYASKILSPLPCRLSADGRLLEPSGFSLILASVLRDVGLHMLVAHRAGEDPRRPHLVASPLPPRALAPQWPRVALGLPLVGRCNFDGLVDSFRVDFPDGGPFVLDGDTFKAKSVVVRAGPEITVVT